MGEQHYPWHFTNGVMARAGFSVKRVARAHIWAAKFNTCPKCEAPPFTPCRNLLDIKEAGWSLARQNKGPHTERIDYVKLTEQLKKMGYE